MAFLNDVSNGTFFITELVTKLQTVLKTSFNQVLSCYSKKPGMMYKLNLNLKFS